jgi:hypothetical protein
MQAELVALRVLQHHREVIEPFQLEHTIFTPRVHCAGARGAVRLLARTSAGWL